MTGLGCEDGRESNRLSGIGCFGGDCIVMFSVDEIEVCFGLRICGCGPGTPYDCYEVLGLACLIE